MKSWLYFYQPLWKNISNNRKIHVFIKGFELIQLVEVEWVWKSKFRSSIGSGTCLRKTLPESTCMAKWSLKQRFWITFLQHHQTFHGHRIFQHFIIKWQASILSLKLFSTTTDLIPNPFESGIEEHIPALPGRIQVSVPSPNISQQRSQVGNQLIRAKNK